MCLLLGATGVGKTLLLKRLYKISLKESLDELGEPPPTLPTVYSDWLNVFSSRLASKLYILLMVGTNLTDIAVNKRKITIRELGGCMGPIWPSYYGECEAVIFMIDAANPTQISSSCIQLLSVLAAEQLQQTSVLILFNKVDLPCHMSLVEMKSLFRMDDIIACAKQRLSVLEVSSRDGRGLEDVLKWLRSHCKGKQLPRSSSETQ
ncbi:ADP-ribosylation factor-like protein 16 isoform X1 [Heptranchias perlo]|uniref:ADP-ribosylation factor-like protein 16 isoform X1 n=2 Tax=Heptranchias perlo TaxID=212740 RepID=UPI00355A7642